MSSLKRKAWELILPFSVDPFSKGKQNKFDRVASPESVSIPLKLNVLSTPVLILIRFFFFFFVLFYYFNP